MHIAIAGNIGAGKTTLTELLSKHYKWDTHYEDVDQNPYLLDFYDDMQRWSFNLQVYYLNSRFTQIQDIKESKNTIIQDRTIHEDAYIFAPNLHSMGLIYLRASVPKLVNNIQKRGREYEESIRLDYLKRLNERYEAWISTYDSGKLLIIDIDENSFHDNPEDLGKIISQIDAELHGLF
jgi:deoxyadenosine/deoxycytidine kinase